MQLFCHFKQVISCIQCICLQWICIGQQGLGSRVGLPCTSNIKMFDYHLKLILPFCSPTYEQCLPECINVLRCIYLFEGMESTSCDRKVRLDTYIHSDNYVIFDGTVGSIQKDFYRDGTTVKKNDQGKYSIVQCPQILFIWTTSHAYKKYPGYYLYEGDTFYMVDTFYM